MNLDLSVSHDDRPLTEAISVWKDTPTQTIDVGGTAFAYRQLGPRGGIPLVFLHHFTAVLDDWDPRVIDPIAQERHLITFDNRGIGGSRGQGAPTNAAVAPDAAAVIPALRPHHGGLLRFFLRGGGVQEGTTPKPRH